MKLKLTDWRLSSFEAGVEGVDPITHEAQEMTAARAKKVMEAAEKSGVQITKEK